MMRFDAAGFFGPSQSIFRADTARTQTVRSDIGEPNEPKSPMRAMSPGRSSRSILPPEPERRTPLPQPVVPERPAIPEGLRALLAVGAVLTHATNTKATSQRAVAQLEVHAGPVAAAIDDADDGDFVVLEKPGHFETAPNGRAAPVVA